MANVRGLIAKGPPATPKFHLILRIVALALSVACFIAACYNVAQSNRILTSNFSEDAPGGLAIFTCIWTWIVLGLDIAFSLMLQSWYLRIIFFISYILTLIFWLSAWALAAAAASDVLACSDRVCTRYGGAAAAIAALGALLWVLLIVIFVFWFIAAVKNTPENTAAVGHNLANDTELGAVKADHGYPAGTTNTAHSQQQYAPQGYVPEQHGTPGPYQQQQSPYAAPGSPPPQQPVYGQNGTPYPEQPVGYPQEPHNQSPPQQYPQQQHVQQGAPYPQ